MKRIIFILLPFIFCLNNVSIGADSLLIHNFLEIVVQNHPLIQKANLFDEMAAAIELKGAGTLDPKLSSNFQSKRFSDTNYFNIWHTEAKVPTRLPVDFSVGYERNNGVFLNDENAVPDNGLIYGTFNVSLLRGLLFDEQRYNLNLAEIKAVKSQIEKQILTREILYQSILVYLKWSANFRKNQIANNFLSTIQIRHTNVIELFINGDRPAVDTIESRINLNNAQKNLLKSEQDLMIAKQQLDLFLWDDQSNPMTLNSEIVPGALLESIKRVELMTGLIDPDFRNDPLVRKFQNQIDEIENSNRLAKEDLKPQLDLKYNTILSLGKDEVAPSFALNNYKYGVTVGVPIRNRKTRGTLLMNDVLIAQNEIDQNQYLQQLINKFQTTSLNRIVQLEIVDVELEKLSNYEVLFEAETIKFDIGESSVFMLNQREVKLFETRLDIVNSYFKYGKIVSELFYLRQGQE